MKTLMFLPLLVVFWKPAGYAALAAWHWLKTKNDDKRRIYTCLSAEWFRGMWELVRP
jgi:hypothetical protein